MFMSIFPNIFGKLFETFTLPKLIRLVGELDSPKYWKKSFQSASKLTPEFPEEIVSNLVNNRALLRFLLNTFKVEKQLPTITDFTIAIAFELRRNHIEVSTGSVKKFAANLYREWCKSLNNQPSLKNYLKDTRDIHPSALFEENEVFDDELNSIISDDKTLQIKYFESYSEKGGSDTIRVYLQNEDRFLPYSVDDGLVVTLNLHTAQGADFGFFLIGYDYVLIKEGKQYWLRGCYKNKTLGTETARFQNHELGDTSGEVLWLM